ncbi:MAG: DUF1659 domain-containing protein [Lysinibacillus sp.]
MANLTFVNATLRLKYVTGQDDQGKEIVKSKSYRNLNSTHTAASLIVVANAIASLSSRQLNDVERVETTELA